MAKKKVAKKKSPVKKKSVKKKPTRKPSAKTHAVPHLSAHERQTEKILIENFVALQKVMTNLSLKLDNLTTQISKLLELFEISAKALAEKDVSLDKEAKDSSKMMSKIDNLFEQNKVIARGLTLLHEQEPAQRTLPQQMPRPMQARPSPEQYQKSISAKEQTEQPPKPNFNKLPRV